jgi:hypothetical protein
MYNKTLEEYFGVTSAVASTWRKKSFPKNRLNEFIINEKSFSIYDLFEKIYPKNQK